MAKKRLSRDQKRKAKLAERRKKHPGPPPSLAYEGSKYKTPELTPVFLATETGIVQADTITQHKLTDRLVRSALEELVQGIPKGLPPFDPQAELTYTHGKETDLIVQMIRLGWHELFEDFPHPGNDTLVGVLRTLLGSVETFTTPGPDSRGYLSYVIGFLRKAGVRPVLKGAEGEMVEEPEDPFLEVGEAWVLDGDSHARIEFLRQAERMVAAGHGERVAEVAQMLLGQVDGPGPVSMELSRVAVAAQAGQSPQLPG